MKDSSTRITIEYIINMIISGIALIGGISVIFAGFGVFGELDEALEKTSESALAMIFAGPFIIVGYIIAAVAVFFIGFIPLFTGTASGLLTHIARFKYTENGTVVTKGYKILMTAVYIVYGVVLSIYGSVFLFLIPDMLSTK